MTADLPNDFDLFLSAYDWREAMTYAKFKCEDIQEIIHKEDGENDEKDWKLVARLKNGKYGWLSAGCDYSGWDCQAHGRSGIVDTKEEAMEEIK